MHMVENSWWASSKCCKNARGGEWGEWGWSKGCLDEIAYFEFTFIAFLLTTFSKICSRGPVSTPFIPLTPLCVSMRPTVTFSKIFPGVLFQPPLSPSPLCVHL